MGCKPPCLGSRDRRPQEILRWGEACCSHPARSHGYRPGSARATYGRGLMQSVGVSCTGADGGSTQTSLSLAPGSAPLPASSSSPRRVSAPRDSPLPLPCPLLLPPGTQAGQELPTWHPPPQPSWPVHGPWGGCSVPSSAPWVYADPAPCPSHAAWGSPLRCKRSPPVALFMAAAIWAAPCSRAWHHCSLSWACPETPAGFEMRMVD